MENPLKIKICGLNHYENILELSLLEPDFMGFIFYKNSPRFFKLESLPNINPYIKKVGVFVEETIENIIHFTQKFQLDYVQLHGQENLEYCKKLKKNNIKIIKAFAIHDNFDFMTLQKFEGYCEYFLFDSVKGGSGTPFSWDNLHNYQGKTPFLLAGGIGLDNLKNAIELRNCFPQMIGLDWNSKWEIYYGIKNLELIKQGLNIIKNSYDKT